MNKRYAYVIDNGKDTIYDLSKKGVILENHMDITETLNEQDAAIEELKKEVLNVVDRKIKNNDSNPSHDFQIYSKVNNALKDVREELRNIIEEF